MLHYNTVGNTDFGNHFDFPTVTKKLKNPMTGSVACPYQKPQQLVNKLIEMFSHPADWILDLFSGSGTTSACAVQKGKHVAGVELDESLSNFVKMRLAGLSVLSDEFQEVGKLGPSEDSIAPFVKEPQPPASGVVGDVGDLAEVVEQTYNVVQQVVIQDGIVLPIDTGVARIASPDPNDLIENFLLCY